MPILNTTYTTYTSHISEENIQNQNTNNIKNNDIYTKDDTYTEEGKKNNALISITIVFILIILIIICCSYGDCISEVCNYHINSVDRRIHIEPRHFLDWEVILENPKTISIENIEEKNNKDCLICLEEFKKEDDINLLKCQHYFHQKCIQRWINTYSSIEELKEKNCPICREKLKLKIIKF